MIGTHIGPYHLLAKLGEGGMGEVYRARDTKLNRDVAIKILPPAFANDPDRLARFKREAQVLASLNHPNIGAIHGFEDGSGAHALVLELVEGPTLADRIALGRLEIDEALAIASQIADALGAAHEQGIIHRDLKPANIKVRDDGTVKVLDFGLAKLADPVGAGRPGGPSVTQSPTITTPAMTAAGMILGTAAYMSPEQAKGRPADKRSDIWAFGCVLYEMLTGKRAFEGEDVSDTLAAILRGEPNWSALPGDLPPGIRSLLRRSLARDIKQRIGDIAVAKFLFTESSAAAVAPAAMAEGGGRPRMSTTRIALLLTAALLVGASLGAVVLRRPTPAVEPRLVGRFSMSLPEGQNFPNASRSVIGISPDGSQIAYVANSQLNVRSISDIQPRAIPGTESKENQYAPVFSPDGQSIAFLTASTIKRIPVTGGTASTVCQVSTVPNGLSWDGDDLVFGDGSHAIMRVPAKGGTPEALVTLGADEIADSPQLLDGGRYVLFSIAKGTNQDRWQKASVVVQSLRDNVRTTVIDAGASARYIPSGHIVYGQGGALFAVRFNLTEMKAVGAPSPVIEGVRRNGGYITGVFQFSVSNTGSLAYIPGSATSFISRSLALVDRSGASSRVPVPIGSYLYPRVSKNGHLAVQVDDGTAANVWTYDFQPNSAMRRVTFGGRNRFPIWSADGQRIAFQSDREGDLAIWTQRLDGSDGGPKRLTKAESGVAHIPESWSPDGLTILYAVRGTERYTEWALSLPAGTSKPFGDITSAEPINAMFSPDGHWVTYSSNQTAGGTPSADRGVYVQSFPGGTRSQVPNESRDFHPVWSRDGSELIYVPTSGRFSIVSFQTRPSVSFGRPVTLPVSIRHERLSTDTRDFDIMPDGRLLLTTPGDDSTGAIDSSPQIRIVLNWFDELKQKVAQ